MRSFLFNIIFYVFTFLFALFCVVLSILPGRKPMMWGLRTYTRFMVAMMQEIADIDVQVTGRNNVPKDGAVIIAAKHQSYGDGLVLFSQFFDLSFVTGDHLEKFWLLKRILAKAGAVVVDSCGGSNAREKLSKTSKLVREQGRRLLIYPEGHLSKIGTQHRYRKGVFFMYQDFNCPVVPVATNLGQRWNQNDWTKHPGSATLEFLEPIPPGLEKDEFMARLENMIETRSRELLDMKNLGALDPANIGKVEENEVAREKRLAREKEETDRIRKSLEHSA